MKYKINWFITILVAIEQIIFLIAIAYLVPDEKCNCDYCNDTRDYDYEHYCDSIWITNPDYYLDVLTETDNFKNYVEKYGQWWR